jgi:hypothetical protein
MSSSDAHAHQILVRGTLGDVWNCRALMSDEPLVRRAKRSKIRMATQNLRPSILPEAPIECRPADSAAECRLPCLPPTSTMIPMWVASDAYSPDVVVYSSVADDSAR